MENQINAGFTRRKKQKVAYGNYAYEGGFFHPMIKIAGKFLKDFDFNVGDSIEVNVSMGQITINKVPKDYAPPTNELNA